MEGEPVKRWLAGAAVLVLGLAALPGGAAAAKPLPVPNDFLLSAVAAGTNFLGNAPGTNDWHCKPSAAHPEPVVLVHGFLGDKTTNWQTYGPLLKNNGYCVFALTYGASPTIPAPYNEALGGLNPIPQSAVEVGAFVRKVLAATHAKKVDILGHSEGTIVPDYYAKFLGGAKYIDKYISLAPLWHGTTGGGLATLYQLSAVYGVKPVVDALTGAVAPVFTEFLTGSALVAKLRSGGTPAVKGISYTNITTKDDELVTPYTSGIQAGMKNYVVQNYCKSDFTEHFEIVADPVAAALVLNALDPAHPRPIPCTLVLPFVGPPGSGV
jgi:triacylglycerol lipase